MSYRPEHQERFPSTNPMLFVIRLQNCCFMIIFLSLFKYEIRYTLMSQNCSSGMFCCINESKMLNLLYYSFLCRYKTVVRLLLSTFCQPLVSIPGKWLHVVLVVDHVSAAVKRTVHSSVCRWFE